jgi:serine/threonine protein kinase
MSFESGQMIGLYRIAEKLGQGGMATVYKACQIGLNRDVAIKVLHKDFVTDASFLARFKREAQLIAKLDHPNIVPGYDFFEYDGQPILVMKYIQGETLKERLQRGPLSKDEIFNVVTATGKALSYAHAQGILHRDIKPSNIIIDHNGQIYLADFGLARILQGTNTTLTGDMIVGTPQYIAPEQALGKLDIDEGVDIYSLGVMLYEMVVGQVPFQSTTPISIIQDHIYTPLPLPSVTNPDITFALEQVLVKALAKKRPDRFATVKEMIKDFVNAWQTQPDLNQGLENMPFAQTETLVQEGDNQLILAHLVSENKDVYPIKISSFTIGRITQVAKTTVDLDLTLLDIKKVVSRRHAELDYHSGQFMITDLGSTNGTFVNSQKLAPNVPLVLKSGDIIELGKNGVKLTFIPR